MDSTFELLDGSYSISDIQNYIKYIIKKQETFANSSSIKIYLDKTENRILSKTKY